MTESGEQQKEMTTFSAEQIENWRGVIAKRREMYGDRLGGESWRDTERWIATLDAATEQAQKREAELNFRIAGHRAALNIAYKRTAELRAGIEQRIDEAIRNSAFPPGPDEQIDGHPDWTRHGLCEANQRIAELLAEIERLKAELTGALNRSLR